MARELSTTRRNVLRRAMYATRAIEQEVDCPDCGTSMFLMEGRWGRFYRCHRFDCRGTHGARLDGTPTSPRGTPELLAARRRARDAVHAVVVERDRMQRAIVVWGKTERLQWWREPHNLACCKDDFRAITFAAKLNPVVMSRVKTQALRSVFDRGLEFVGGGYVLVLSEPAALFIRKRSIEDCTRITEAAQAHLERIRAEFATHPCHGWWRHVGLELGV